MAQEIFQVDAFTNRPFAGNPAAVCILPQPRDDRWMQNVAREMNLSETAFLHKQDDGFNLRWFTPATEVDLCGHATLASAHILWQMDYLQPNEEALFHTRSGLLTARLKGEWIQLNFPAQVPVASNAPTELIQALGATPKRVGKHQMHYLLELDSEETVRNLKPDFTLLKTLPVRGLIVTSIATSPGYDFVSRYFAPAVGIDEDPVTGSAHCYLGPYWRDCLGKDDFVAYQASLRGGVIKVSCQGDRILLGGQAVLVLRGVLNAD
jgi:PhzF family phenazine biosynthesis protein